MLSNIALRPDMPLGPLDQPYTHLQSTSSYVPYVPIQYNTDRGLVIMTGRFSDLANINIIGDLI